MSYSGVLTLVLYVVGTLGVFIVAANNFLFKNSEEKEKLRQSVAIKTSSLMFLCLVGAGLCGWHERQETLTLMEADLTACADRYKELKTAIAPLGQEYPGLREEQIMERAVGDFFECKGAISELRKNQEESHLTDDQSSAIVSALKPHGPRRLIIQSEDEQTALTLSSDIQATIREAGWSVEAKVTQASSQLPLMVLVKDAEKQPGPDNANVIITALENAGLKVTADSNPKLDAAAAVLMVGTRPCYK